MVHDFPTRHSTVEFARMVESNSQNQALPAEFISRGLQLVVFRVPKDTVSSPSNVYILQFLTMSCKGVKKEKWDVKGMTATRNEYGNILYLPII